MPRQAVMQRRDPYVIATPAAEAPHADSRGLRKPRPITVLNSQKRLNCRVLNHIFKALHSFSQYKVNF